MSIDPVMIPQRLSHLARRERALRAMPTTDPDQILAEDETLEAIRQEKRDLAHQLKQHEEQARQARQDKTDARADARDTALEEAEKLRASLLKRAKAFEGFIEDYQELVRLEHVAFTADRHLLQNNDSRAMGLDNLEAGRAMDRTRTALTNAFGPDLFGLPPFAARRNAGYGFRDAVEGARIRLY